jgi:hypothetical protein
LRENGFTTSAKSSLFAFDHCSPEPGWALILLKDVWSETFNKGGNIFKIAMNYNILFITDMYLIAGPLKCISSYSEQ